MPTVSENQLALYNDSLQMVEERRLASLTENRKPRFELDVVWNGGGVNACLEEADWTFARRSVQILADPNIQPSFGFIHGFKQPPDWLRTSAIASDPYYQAALTQYADEGGYWWSDIDTIYVKYVSNDAAYGGNLALWPEWFKQFAAAHFAEKIVGQITHSEKIQQKVEKLREKHMYAARGKNGMDEPPGFFPRGQLSRARQGLYFGRPDRIASDWS
jgi:hypothetical protein